jgi:pimeloyl-ACP methyl ester carboxylesterase
VSVASGQVLTTDGVDVAFDERGTGRPIVFLHGLCESRQSWQPVTDRLAPEFRCITFDFRGHGESTRLAHYEPAGFLTDLAAVVDETCESPPFVIGHSLGGLVATVAAALGIAGPAISIDQPLQQGSFAVLVRSMATRLRDPSSFPDALMEEKRALGLDMVREPMFTLLEHQARTCDQAVVLETWAPMLDDDLGALAQMDESTRAVVSSSTAPYLTIHGTPTDPGYESWLATVLPQAQLEVWSGLGHWLHLVAPDRFVTRAREFLLRGDSEPNPIDQSAESTR